MRLRFELRHAAAAAGVSRPSTTPAMRGVDAGLNVQSHTVEPEHDVDRLVPTRAGGAQDHDKRQPGNGRGEPAEAQVVGVDDRDHDDGADVVDDRQGQQDSTFRRARHPSPSRASTPRAKAMSVAIGMPQPAAPAPPALTRPGSSAAGTTMPPSAAKAGSAASRAVAQLAAHQLPLDLEPHDEEEEGHQPVVHPVAEVLGAVERADPEDDLGAPEAVVATPPRRVGPHERDHRRDEQHDAAGRLDVQELLQPAGRRRGRASWSLLEEGGHRLRALRPACGSGVDDDVADQPSRRSDSRAGIRGRGSRPSEASTTARAASWSRRAPHGSARTSGSGVAASLAPAASRLVVVAEPSQLGVPVGLLRLPTEARLGAWTSARSRSCTMVTTTSVVVRTPGVDSRWSAWSLRMARAATITGSPSSLTAESTAARSSATSSGTSNQRRSCSNRSARHVVQGEQLPPASGSGVLGLAHGQTGGPRRTSTMPHASCRRGLARNSTSSVRIRISGMPRPRS